MQCQRNICASGKQTDDVIFSTKTGCFCDVYLYAYTSSIYHERESEKCSFEGKQRAKTVR